mgnify:CR=1 FL=1
MPNSELNSLPSIMLVDDEMSILAALKRELNAFEAQIISFTSAEDALAHALNNPPQLLISDQRMPGMTGTELMESLQLNGIAVPAILLSAYQDFSAVSQAFNAGCLAKFISKPWDNEELSYLVGKLLAAPNNSQDDSSSQNTDNKESTANIPPHSDMFHSMLSDDSAMRTIFQTISNAATASVPIFIGGETGTGKELAAKACHLESYRHAQPFIAFNCANFNEGLMESQLFGHKKGAFTGANSDQQGLFSQAANGCLFLDEVTTLNAAIQAKLLRVIQEKEFSPLGSDKLVQFKATLITASSTTLRDAVAKGEFREDLFYRLNVISIQLPALRERHNDAQLLAKYFLERFEKQHNRETLTFSEDALKLISQYPWPGNIRQLENVIHNVVIMNQQAIIDEKMLSLPLAQYDLDLSSTEQAQPVTLPVEQAAPMQSSVDSISQIQPLADLEKQAIESAIEQCQGNVAKAAVLLEVSASTLYRKINSWQQVDS